MRDWGHARDYVRAMYLMLQQDEPDDYVIATGEQHSVRQMCACAFAEIGVTLAWEGSGEDEVGVVGDVDEDVLHAARGGGAEELALAPTDFKPGLVLVRVDPRYYRPTEVNTLLGDATKARERLGWTPTIGFEELIAEMVRDDLADARRDDAVVRAGFEVVEHRE
jgi:GDPmannose 4,6-dehydratase